MKLSALMNTRRNYANKDKDYIRNREAYNNGFKNGRKTAKTLCMVDGHTGLAKLYCKQCVYSYHLKHLK